jgi:lantibiotic modifying enzyme
VLFDPAHHEELVAREWDEARVRAAVREIVAEAEGAFDDGAWWPLHPRDAEDAPIDVYWTHGLWSGAAGVLWALHRLARAGAVTLERDYAFAAARLHGDYLRRAGGDMPAVPGLWAGEAGILLVAHMLAPDAARADRLFEVVRENARSETNELMWGSPGTMVAARTMLALTGDERWAGAWHESAARLWDEWTWSDAHRCYLWTQRLYGQVREYVGPAHGFAGDVAALAQLAREERLEEIARRATDAIRTLAFREDGLANWAPLAGGDLAVPGQGIRVQWCHGAPGIVASLASLPPERDLDELLLAGGELTWVAGPLAKGPGLCHGTAGNGFALLALYRRTGDAVWLERARAFAVHALDQVERERVEHGRGRFSLWSGDLGAAVYAWQCIDGDAAFPTIDAW